MASVTVCVVGICGARSLSRCLAALHQQVDAPTFDVVVVYDPQLGELEQVAEPFENVRLVRSKDSREPAVMAARCLGEASGDVVLLTEDHCKPAADWLRKHVDAHRSEAAVVGGSIEIESGIGLVNWAFCFVDFFRYAKPLAAGPVEHVSVCNVSYKRSGLEAVASHWREKLHETSLHDALRERFGPLIMCPEAEVTMQRRVRFTDAMRERYAFGRWFACRRLAGAKFGGRLKWIVLSMLLPAVLMWRMACTALVRSQLRAPFVRSIFVVMALVVAWSAGEWMGYLTGRPPRSLIVAQEVD